MNHTRKLRPLKAPGDVRLTDTIHHVTSRLVINCKLGTSQGLYQAASQSKETVQTLPGPAAINAPPGAVVLPIMLEIICPVGNKPQQIFFHKATTAGKTGPQRLPGLSLLPDITTLLHLHRRGDRPRPPHHSRPRRPRRPPAPHRSWAPPPAGARTLPLPGPVPIQPP